MITKLGLLAASEAAFKLKLFDNTAAVKTDNDFSVFIYVSFYLSKRGKGSSMIPDAGSGLHIPNLPYHYEPVRSIDSSSLLLRDVYR